MNNNFKIALLIQGIVLIGMGLYFIFFRPALLPEDLSYIGTSEVEVNKHLPGLTHWLQKVFIVLGGYIVSSGLLMLYIGIAKYNRKDALLFTIILISGSTSILMMTIVNFIIDSDFKWVLLSFSTPWAWCLITYFSPGSIKTSK